MNDCHLGSQCLPLLGTQPGRWDDQMGRAARQWGPTLLGMSGSVATSFSAVKQSRPLYPSFSYVAAAVVTTTLRCLFLGATSSVTLLKVCKKISLWRIL